MRNRARLPKLPRMRHGAGIYGLIRDAEPNFSQSTVEAGEDMYAHRTKARVEPGHRVTVELPSDFPSSEVDVIVLPAASDTGEDQTASRQRQLTVDELLASRLTPPPGVGPISLADMETAIAEGALGRGDV